MALAAWIVLGVVAGFVASKVMNRQANGEVLNTVLGLIGALVGGVCFKKFSAADTSEMNLYSVLAAVAGAIVMLFIFHAFLRHTVHPRHRSGWH